jgi:hypothetical protein
MIRKLSPLPPSSAANLSLILLVAGWLVAAYGVLSQFGDPNPHTPAAVIVRIPVHAGHQFRSMPGHDSGPCRATIPVDAGRGV